jgi:sulfur-carrier protein adenylyltransferase/sulfurtransferase
MNKSMRLSVLLTSALLLFAVLTQTACNKRNASERSAGANTQKPQTPATQAPPPQDGVRRISISELQEALEKGLAMLVDVRGSVEYKLGHIKGAVSLPLGLIAQQFKDLPKDKLIVTYCA